MTSSLIPLIKKVHRNIRLNLCNPLETGCKFNGNMTFREHPERLLVVSCKFNLRSVLRGMDGDVWAVHGTKYDKYFEAPFHKNKFGGIKLTRLVKKRKKNFVNIFNRHYAFDYVLKEYALRKIEYWIQKVSS